MMTILKEGVGIMITKGTDKKVTKFKSINSRIMSIWVNIEVEIKLNIIQIYAPTEGSKKKINNF